MCAPSDSAMNGSNGHSFSLAGSEPSSTPSHVSTSGPLEGGQPDSQKIGGVKRGLCMVEADNAHNRAEGNHIGSAGVIWSKGGDA